MSHSAGFVLLLLSLLLRVQRAWCSCCSSPNNCFVKNFQLKFEPPVYDARFDEKLWSNRMKESWINQRWDHSVCAWIVVIAMMEMRHHCLFRSSLIVSSRFDGWKGAILGGYGACFESWNDWFQLRIGPSSCFFHSKETSKNESSKFRSSLRPTPTVLLLATFVVTNKLIFSLI